MTNMIKLACGAVLVSGLLSGAAFAEQATVRIIHGEPYGAVVTDENGVLVFRALPATQRVIINPQGKTQLSLNVSSVEKTVTYDRPKVMKRIDGRWVTQ